MDNKARFSICAAAIGLAIAGAARADGVKFQDPIGDDKGPGTYTYPTDAAYTQGSFDLTEFEITAGDSPDVKVSVNGKLADPWGMGVGFATQMVFIFIDKDGKAMVDAFIANGTYALIDSRDGMVTLKRIGD
jgi:carbohydrate-binding DOMON domain-containing protein